MTAFCIYYDDTIFAVHHTTRVHNITPAFIVYHGIISFVFAHRYHLAGYITVIGRDLAIFTFITSEPCTMDHVSHTMYTVYFFILDAYIIKKYCFIQIIRVIYFYWMSAKKNLMHYKVSKSSFAIAIASLSDLCSVRYGRGSAIPSVKTFCL